MYIFIWKKVDQCSNNYHSTGGVVVIAEDQQKARELANQQTGCSIRDDEIPDYCCEIVTQQARVFIFPNAGCC